jgi:hypothetical protein
MVDNAEAHLGVSIPVAHESSAERLAVKHPNTPDTVSCCDKEKGEGYQGRCKVLETAQRALPLLQERFAMAPVRSVTCCMFRSSGLNE